MCPFCVRKITIKFTNEGSNYVGSQVSDRSLLAAYFYINTNHNRMSFMFLCSYFKILKGSVFPRDVLEIVLMRRIGTDDLLLSCRLSNSINSLSSNAV